MPPETRLKAAVPDASTSLLQLTGALLKQTSRATEVALELGPQAAARHAARRLLGAIRGPDSFRIILIALTKPRPSPEAAVAARNHLFRFASRDELEAYGKDPSTGVNPWDLEAFANGSRCLLQLDGDQLVGYSWVAGSPLIELMWGMHFNLPDDTAYNYNGFTAPKYRGTAFQGLRHLKVLEQLKGEGKKRLFAYVDDVNYRSLRGVEKSGYQRIGVLSGTKRAGKILFSLRVENEAWSEVVRFGPRQHQAPAPVHSKIVQ
ncbi:MAG: acyl-CoA N-acyltransferase [Myxococcaceae bacterium]|nr:acyl-CoA N-acyltransferase [Myxococcaceae bacterium]